MAQNMKYFSIGSLSRMTGCKLPTIRYYESEYLLHAAYRTEGNQRRYDESHLKRLQFIRHARDLGFKQSDIHELIKLSINEHSNHEADELAKRHLEEVDDKISKLTALKKELSHMLEVCEKNGLKKCNVVDVLADHKLCLNKH